MVVFEFCAKFLFLFLRYWCLLLASIRCLANPDLFTAKFDFRAISVFGLLRDFCFLFAARLLFSALLGT